MTANETDPATRTRSSRPEAPAEAASDAPTGNPSQPRPTLPEGMGELDRRAIDTVRVLAMDAVQKAGNGHPGTAMSVGPTAYLLFQKWLRHDPGDPDWAGRDRFVLSMGHSSLTLYIQLFLSGYGLELSDLEALRTWGSRTPGHPEVNHTPGVETTTGPLGQGVGNAVGMAMAARRERGLLDPDAPEGESVFDHTVWAFASDGDLEEGVSGEASSLAGTQELGNLVLVYDANRISIEDNTGIAFTEDVGTRYEAYGWHVQHVDDGEDLVAVDRALGAAQAETARPSMIVLRTIIGWPSPNKQNTGAAHGSALGEDEVRATKDILGFDPGTTFEVAPEVLEHARLVAIRGKQAHARWQQRFDAWRAGNPGGGALLERLSTRTLPEGWADTLPAWDADPGGVATRKASGEVLAALYPVLPELWGGSADLAESNNTAVKGAASFLPADRQTKMWSGGPYGRTLHFGVREHAMGAIMNGIALHGGTRVYGGTFLTFSDYMRGAVRLAALMQLPVTYVWTHDSIGLGEDGPTHQPSRALCGAAGHPRPGLRPPGRRQRDRGGVAHHPRAQRPPGRALAVPAEPARLGPHGVRVGRGRRQGRVRAGRGLRRHPRGHPDRHRLRGADRRRRPPGAGGRRRPGKGRLAALLGMVRGPGPGLPRAGAAAHGARPGERRGRCAHGLAGVRRRRRPDRRPGPLRRQRGLHRAVRAVRPHRRRGRRRGAGEPYRRRGAAGAPAGPDSAGVLHTPTGDR